MQTFLSKLKLLFRDKQLRGRVLFILGLLIAFRLLSSVPLPGIDTTALTQFLQNNQFFGLLNIFSGGALSQFSIALLGVGPFITSSIVIQLLTIISPKLKEMYHHEGEIGRKKFNKISRLVTIPIAIIQGLGLLVLLSQQGILAPLSPLETFIHIVIVVAGSFLLTWLGELISEFGIGNGVSIIIFAGIVSSLPGSISQFIYTYTPSQLPLYLGFIVLVVAMIAGIVLITEAERPLSVVYAKHSRGGQTYGGTSSYIPLRINMAGVMPIIFGVSILLFPQMLANFFTASQSVFLQTLGTNITNFFSNQVLYIIIYFFLVALFTYFYTAITFDPSTMAENLQKTGAFIPGIRPGIATEEYVGGVVQRVTFYSALFLGILAVMPNILQAATGVQLFAVGGTSILIVVGVITDLITKINANISMREY